MIIMNKKSKTQYSKILPLLTGFLFAIVIIYSMLFNQDGMNNSMIYITAITTSGGCFGASIIWYMKKSQVENVSMHKKDLYKTISEEQINYAREMMKLQTEFNVSKEQIDSINFESQLDELKDDSIRDMQNTINNAMSDAESETSIQNY